MTDAVKMAIDALTDIRTSIECAAGCDEGIDPMAAVSEIMSAYGTAMASAYSRAADMVNIPAALEQAGEPVDRKKRMDALWRVLREYRLEDGKTVAELIKSGHDRISILAGLADASGEVIALQLDRKVGMHGSAYDPPGPCRAYTYEHQPSNLPAYSLGQAHAAASAMSAGDNIDRGLGLLKALEEQGFGVFEIEQGGARDD
ncbi:hypothetical protein [Sphingobium yanoikuyae]|uniref:hypothetical protein n=1 Tax=Sphingobium yanoikuyae TaxID=13690 RepID=UPI0035C84FD1